MDAPTAARALAAILLNPRELYSLAVIYSLWLLVLVLVQMEVDIHDNRRRISRQRTPRGKHNKSRDEMRPATIM